MEKRFRDREGQHRNTIGVTLSELAVAVAYYYKLTPEQVSNFSGQQLMLYYQYAYRNQTNRQMISLRCFLAPHLEHPNEAVRSIERAIEEMVK